MDCKHTRFINAFLLALPLFILSCSNGSKVTIRVEVKSPEKNMLYISRIDFGKTTPIDSAKISSGESIKKFRLPQGSEPTFYTISLKKWGALTLLASRDEKISVKFDVQNMDSYEVVGSKESLKVKEIAESFRKSKQTVDRLRKEYIKAQTDAEREAIGRQFQAEIDSQRASCSRFIWANPMSKASIMALYQKYNDDLYLFDRAEDLTLLKMVASAWRALYPESDYTRGMLEDIGRIEKIITNSKINKLISEAEPSIPDLDIPDKNGTFVKLSSLKGKVILLDFFTASNTSSLLDNRELMNIYNTFKNRGFEVYQVSMDADKNEWLNYLSNTRVTWISVREVDPTHSAAALLYNVTQLPTNYLIDKNFNIIDKNIYGERLKEKLNVLLR
ncbi:MAG: redoxin domain-containing protein [Bacteroidales bacterium]|nr:redoxin domain-containing protein [Bacteroidales bacterium]